MYHLADTNVAAVIVMVVRMENLVSVYNLFLNVIPKVNQFVCPLVKVVDMSMSF
jgi:hypothetical protein